MSEQYLKMADVFEHGVDDLSFELCNAECKNVVLADFYSMTDCSYAAHAINSHDELVRQRDELLAAMKTIANSEEFHGDSFICDFDSLQSVARATISNLNLNTRAGHSPDAGNMVPGGLWQVVPVDPTIEMVQAATHNSVGFGTRAAYKAMLAAAPKHEGGAS